MKGFITIIIIAVLIFIGYSFISNPSEEASPEEGAMMMSHPVTVSPIAHATAVLTWGESTLYADPVGGAAAFSGHESPDIVLLTDIHQDHLDVATLEAIVTEETMLVAPQAVADELSQELLTQTTVLANGETAEIGGFSIEAVPMYNLPQSEDSYHIKGRGNGYVIEKDGTRLYLAGDTSGTPEMQALTDIAVALVPMNLPYTMSVEEAAEAVLAFAPKTVYPYHYRGTEGLSDVARFKQLVNAGNPDIEVVLLTWYPEEEKAGGAMMEAGASDVVVEISGKNFEYDVTEIKVSQGDTVTINFTSTSGFHDWVVDEFDAKTAQVNAGGETSVTFVADKAGTYEYYCSVGNHRAQGMVGTLIVE